MIKKISQNGAHIFLGYLHNKITIGWGCRFWQKHSLWYKLKGVKIGMIAEKCIPSLCYRPYICIIQLIATWSHCINGNQSEYRPSANLTCTKALVPRAKWLALHTRCLVRKQYKPSLWQRLYTKTFQGTGKHHLCVSSVKYDSHLDFQNGHYYIFTNKSMLISISHRYLVMAILDKISWKKNLKIHSLKML